MMIGAFELGKPNPSIFVPVKPWTLAFWEVLKLRESVLAFLRVFKLMVTDGGLFWLKVNAAMRGFRDGEVGEPVLAEFGVFNFRVINLGCFPVVVMLVVFVLVVMGRFEQRKTNLRRFLFVTLCG